MRALGRAPFVKLFGVGSVDRERAIERFAIAPSRKFVRRRAAFWRRVQSRWRHAVQQIAARILDEVDAIGHAAHVAAERESHVGFWLVDGGLRKEIPDGFGLVAGRIIVRHQKNVGFGFGRTRVERAQERANPAGNFAGAVSGECDAH